MKRTSTYPTSPRERDAWILARRSPRPVESPFEPGAFLVEEEPSATCDTVEVATLFLRNRECPWRCVMCDLWKTALAETVPPGAIPQQIDFALSQLARRRLSGTELPAAWIKLYNSGSFFDKRAILPNEHGAIAERVAAFERVIVECHPALVGAECLRFRDTLLAARSRLGKPFLPETHLEVAMGLETAHPVVLEKLNKRMTLDQFAHAADFLRRAGMSVRAFVLVQPPFLPESDALEWAARSTSFAFDAGVSVVSLIPTRAGNGAMEALQADGAFSPPRLSTLEAALAYGIQLRRGRVLADLWDLGIFSKCAACLSARQERLRTMNLRQMVLPRIHCPRCGGA